MSNNDNGSFMNGLILGALVGVSAGLLLAPKKGEETMEDLKTKINGVIEEGMKRAEEVRENVQTEVAGRLEEASETVGNVSEAVENIGNSTGDEEELVGDEQDTTEQSEQSK